MNYFLMNTPRMIHSDICFHMRWVGASEYHFDAYKCIRMGLNVKNAFSGFFGFPPKNFSSPYLSSPTWHRSHSVLKIIVWISSLLTNIIQHLRKHIKGTRASDVCLIENFENFQILPFWTQKPIFLYVKGSKWVWYINVIEYPSKISHWSAKTMKKWPIYRYYSVFSQNSGNFGQNRVRVKKCRFPQRKFSFFDFPVFKYDSLPFCFELRSVGENNYIRA